MNDLFNRAAAVVQRYQGTVDKFTGDGLMALFGAPVALEDHALRACIAALEIQTVAEDSLPMSIAVTALRCSFASASTPGTWSLVRSVRGQADTPPSATPSGLRNAWREARLPAEF